MNRRLPPLVLALALAVLVTVWLWPAQAAAHGKELGITVVSLTPDSQKPLERLYRATVAYASDMDPVEDARVELTATRQEGGVPVGPVRLSPLDDTPGVYVGEVTYPRFGTWAVTLRVSGRGEGETVFVDKVTPGTQSAAGGSLAEQEERVRRLQLFFRFDWGDVGNIIVRIIHSLAGVAYFGLTGAVLILLWSGTVRSSVLAKLNSVFLPTVMASLGLLLVSGLYSAAYDAPITPPGIYDLRAMQRLPFGYDYLAAFLVKPLILIALIGIALRMHRALRAGDALPAEGAPGTPDTVGPTALRVRRLALVNIVLGLIVVADVAVVIYLHYISHLGVFLPS